MPTIQSSQFPEGTKVKIGDRNATVICQILDGDKWGDIYVTYDDDNTFTIVKPSTIERLT